MPNPPRKSTELNEEEQLKLKSFISVYMLKNNKAKRREIRRAAEKHFNIVIVD